jgi:hypothetical protein
LQATAALLDADAAGLAGAEAAAPADPAVALPADADLSTPPCPLHAPRPPCAAVVPSLQATGPALLSCAVETAGATAIAATNTAPHIKALSFATFMCSSPKPTARFSGGKNTVIAVAAVSGGSAHAATVWPATRRAKHT